MLNNNGFSYCWMRWSGNCTELYDHYTKHINSVETLFPLFSFEPLAFAPLLNSGLQVPIGPPPILVSFLLVQGNVHQYLCYEIILLKDGNSSFILIFLATLPFWLDFRFYFLFLLLAVICFFRLFQQKMIHPLHIPSPKLQGSMNFQIPYFQFLYV